MSLVSIIIPCYNYGWALTETLDSVLGQTYINWECIIIDDGSTDSTCTIAEEYQHQDNRFKYIYQNNRGLSGARNTGLLYAGGTYIQFLDADDLLVPEKLEYQVNLMVKDPDISIVYGEARYFRNGDRSLLSQSMDMLDSSWMPKSSGEGALVLNRLLQTNIMVVSSPLLRTSLVRQVGVFDETLHSMEDWHYWLRCAIKGAKFHFDSNPACWTLIRMHNNSMSQMMSRMQSNELRVRELVVPLLLEKGLKEAVEINSKWAIYRLESTYIHHIKVGRYKDAVEDIWKLAHKTGRYFYYGKSLLYWLTH